MRSNVIISMKDSKMGLRNAGDILNRIRRKYTKCEAEEPQPFQHNKTFIEEESLELYEQPSAVTDPSQNYQKASSKQEELPQQLSEIKSNHPEAPSFCDQLIRINLESTLKIYQQDLAILTQNGDFLAEQIEALVQKIRKLKELQHNNLALTQENQRSKEYLAQLIQEYQKSKMALFKSQIAQQESFNALRHKLRKVIKDTHQDNHYIGFVNHWNRHIQQSLQDRTAIQLHILKQEKQKREKDSKKDTKMNEQVPKVQIIEVTPKEEPKRQDEYLSPDEARPKKKLTEKEKTSLLGDLKSFAKNFKLPSA